MIVRMWEARVEPGRLDVAARWLTEVAAADVVAGGAERVELFVAAEPEERIVCVSWWATATGRDPEPPPGLVARAHGWDFHPVPPG